MLIGKKATRDKWKSINGYLKKNGYEVADTGYFVYCNGITDKKAFDGKLEFEIKLIPYSGDTSWIEKTLADIKACLESDVIPEESSSCDYCLYTRGIKKIN